MDSHGLLGYLMNVEETINDVGICETCIYYKTSVSALSNELRECKCFLVAELK